MTEYTSLAFIIQSKPNSENFSAVLEKSTVTPLYKGGNSTEVNNYRPISNIPTVGKVLECVIQKQCATYLKNYNVSTDAQYAFRRNHSTGTCLINLLDPIHAAIHNGGIAGALFIDLSKAFDSIDHNTLLIKLGKLGFRLSAQNWFKSYLSNRIQLTKVNGTPL